MIQSALPAVSCLVLSNRMRWVVAAAAAGAAGTACALPVVTAAAPRASTPSAAAEPSSTRLRGIREPSIRQPPVGDDQCGDQGGVRAVRVVPSYCGAVGGSEHSGAEHPTEHPGARQRDIRARTDSARVEPVV